MEQEVVRSRTLKAIGQFAAELAHEVRNPLNAITFQMVLFKKFKAERSDDPCTRQLSEIAEVVDEEIARLTKITRDFLSFTRQESLKREPVNLREAIESSLTLLRGDLESHGIGVSIDEKDGPHIALLDRGRFRQVVVNLVNNAMDALHRGGEVEITISPGPDGMITVTFTDNGPGIPRSLC